MTSCVGAIIFLFFYINDRLENDSIKNWNFKKKTDWIKFDNLTEKRTSNANKCIPTTSTNSKIQLFTEECKEAIRVRKEARRKHCSPEKPVQSINTFELSYDFIITLNR